MSDLKESISREPSNIPYLAIIIDSGLLIQMHLIAERIILDSTTSVVKGMCGLIAAYFAFNIIYPPSLCPMLIFIQHILMGVVDKQQVPPLLTRIYSSISKTMAEV